MNTEDRQSIEAVTKVVYGETFRRYGKEELVEFMRPLEVRLEKNGIPQSVFAGKRCLDAACGSGRATILMARAGAQKVVAYDMTERNIDTTSRNSGLFGLGNVETSLGSLLEMPFPDESFDVVWCNGAIHHTVDPDRALEELARVLKVGGHLWLYVYGAGGIFWAMVDFAREWLRDVEIRDAISHLTLAGFETTRVAEFIDSWYVPIQRRYTNADVSRRLGELGFPDPGYLKGGMTYDSSARRGSAEENTWMGEGDLRYFCRKVSRASGSRHSRLPAVDATRGSEYAEDPRVRAFREAFQSLALATGKVEGVSPRLGRTPALSVAARMQVWLRDRLTRPDAFDPEEFRSWIRGLTEVALGLGDA